MLENKLDKAMIKYNEAMSIRRTYEQILERLKDERAGYDNRIHAIQKSLKAKTHGKSLLFTYYYRLRGIYSVTSRCKTSQNVL